MAQAEGVQFTLSEIAARLGGDVLGNGQTPIRCVATLASAAAGDIAFLANRKYKSQLQSTRAAAVILASDAADAFAGPRIVTANPYAYYARVATLLNPVSTATGGGLLAGSPLGRHRSAGQYRAAGQPGRGGGHPRRVRHWR